MFSSFILLKNNNNNHNNNKNTKRCSQPSPRFYHHTCRVVSVESIILLKFVTQPHLIFRFTSLRHEDSSALWILNFDQKLKQICLAVTLLNRRMTQNYLLATRWLPLQFGPDPFLLFLSYSLSTVYKTTFEVTAPPTHPPRKRNLPPKMSYKSRWVGLCDGLFVVCRVAAVKTQMVDV